MIDLYKLYGLRPSESDPEKIKQAINKNSCAFDEACEYVLLHQGRKIVYDRTRDTLALIGEIRSRLDLDNTSYWGVEYRKFNQSRQRPQKSEWQQARTSHQQAERKTAKENASNSGPSSFNTGGSDHSTSSIRTHYDNLQVAENASIEIIQDAYQFLSQKWHPDKHPNDKDRAARIMKVINEAYSVLSVPERRKEHDAWIFNRREQQFENLKSSHNEDKKASKENKETKETENQLNKVLWLVIVSGAVALKTMQSNLEFALGYILSAFVLGFFLSPIWWFATKKSRNEPWKWYDWLNTAAYAMVILFLLGQVITHLYMRKFGVS